MSGAESSRSEDDSGEDGLRSLAGRITDYDRDIFPNEARQRKQFADFATPPPHPRPPFWQLPLYWLGVWHLAPGYLSWAIWERRSSRNYVVARLFMVVLVFACITATALALAPSHGSFDYLWYAIGWVVPVSSTTRRARNQGGRLLVEPDGISHVAMTLGNAMRLLLFTAACAIAALLPKLVS